jgi:zinc/manganese transport system substrate-binding protein
MRKAVRLVVSVVAVAALAGVVVYAVLTSSVSTPCGATSASSAGGVATVARAGPMSGPAAARAAGPSMPDRSPRAVGSDGVIQVVAAEDFWGSLVAQLGGNQTSVLSIVTDPNTDPHEYETSTSDARTIANAQLVIVNGVGYDEWALQLIAADGNPNQIVLNVGDLNGVAVAGGIVAGNPHMWYDPAYVNRTVAAMYSDLVSLQPSSTSYFRAEYGALNASLGQLYGRAAEIRDRFAGTEVASTESIFVYLANFTDLDLVSPPAFMEAIAEGNDPPAQSVVLFECQLESGKVRVLVYNEQTISPITSEMTSIAAEHNVTVVAVTETIQPAYFSFQAWMATEYQHLESALNDSAPGR